MPDAQAATLGFEVEHRSNGSAIRAWAIVFLLAIIFAMAMIDRVVLSMMIAPIKTDLALSDTAFGLAQGAAVALFYVVFAFPFGWASDRYDRRAIMFVGITIWSLASAGCALVRNFGELFAARALVGAGEAVLGPAGYPMIAALVSRQRLAMAMMIFYLGGTFGNALGQFLGGTLLAALSKGDAVDMWLVGELSPWRAVFLLTGMPGLLLAALIFLAPRDRRPMQVATADVPQGQFRAFFREHRRFYITHNVGMGLQQAALIGAMLWNAAFMARVHGWSPSQIGVTFGTILLLTSAAAVIGHGWILTRLFAEGRADIHLRWQMLMCCMSIPAFAVAYLSPSPLAACIGFGAASLLSGGAVVAGSTVLQIATPPSFRGRTSAIYVVIATLLGTAAGPFAIGLVTDLLGDERLIGVAMAICCVSFCLCAALAFAAGLAATRRILHQTASAIPAAMP